MDDAAAVSDDLAVAAPPLAADDPQLRFLAVRKADLVARALPKILERRREDVTELPLRDRDVADPTRDARGEVAVPGPRVVGELRGRQRLLGADARTKLVRPAIAEDEFVFVLREPERQLDVSLADV